MKKSKRNVSGPVKVLVILCLCLCALPLLGCISGFFADIDIGGSIIGGGGNGEASDSDPGSSDLGSSEVDTDFLFILDGTAYIAEEGMTWSSWCASRYNSAGYLSGSSKVTTSDGSKYVCTYRSDSPVLGSDLIYSNIEYVTKSEMILFTIGGSSYVAVKGMTWAQWVDSSYSSGSSVVYDVYVTGPGDSFVTLNGSKQFESDVIKSGAAYTLVSEGSSASIITFQIDNVLYSAEAGMTWEEFIASSYNDPDGLFAVNGYVAAEDIGASMHKAVAFNELGLPFDFDHLVKLTDKIISGALYYTMDVELPSS